MENIRFKLTKKPHTLGVMQVYTDKFISDIESVEKGTDKILQYFKTSEAEYYSGIKQDYYNDYMLIRGIINDYNPGMEYSEGVLELFDIIKENFYKEHKDDNVLQELDIVEASTPLE